MNDGLKDLSSYGFPTVSADNGIPPDEGVFIKAGLSKAYTWHVGFKILGMVVLKTTFSDRSGVIQEKTYRAYGDKTDMWGAQSELVTALNYAINNLVRMMAKDLVRICKGEKVETYSFGGPEAGGQARTSK